jgi:DNA-binding NtrC family response regulator
MVSKTLKQIQADASRQAIREAMEAADGNRTLAAELLGVSRSQLYRYLVELGLLKKTSSAGGGSRQPLHRRRGHG